ncbi:MAG: hypothetical protein AAFV07_10800, partial [Bacteroidota bacterium]
HMQQYLTYIEQTGKEGFNRILIYGSALVPEEMDIWSDLDLLVECHVMTDIQAAINRLWGQLGDVIARERTESDWHFIDRVVLDTGVNILMVDLKCVAALSEDQIPRLYRLLSGPPLPEHLPSASSKAPSISTATQVESTRFKAYQAVKKFMRGDNLIGLHLLLDLVREALVMQMVVRDQALGTNVHRFGQQEQLPEGLDIREIKMEDLPGLCGYIERLMAYLEANWQRNHPGHVSRQSSFSNFLQDSLAAKK